MYVWNYICNLIFHFGVLSAVAALCNSFRQDVKFHFFFLIFVVTEGQEDTILSYEPVIRQESKWNRFSTICHAVDFYIYPHLSSLFLIQSTTQDLW